MPDKKVATVRQPPKRKTWHDQWFQHIQSCISMSKAQSSRPQCTAVLSRGVRSGQGRVDSERSAFKECHAVGVSFLLLSWLAGRLLCISVSLANGVSACYSDASVGAVCAGDQVWLHRWLAGTSVEQLLL